MPFSRKATSWFPCLTITNQHRPCDGSPRIAKETPRTGDPTRNPRKSSAKGLQTTSGLIEFESSSLKKFDPDDKERPLIPKYRFSWEGHHTAALYKKYPLQLISPHPRFSFHTMGDAKESWINEIKDHRVLKEDGYYYWIIRINAGDAAQKRNRSKWPGSGLFNDRGCRYMCGPDHRAGPARHGSLLRIVRRL